MRGVSWPEHKGKIIIHHARGVSALYMHMYYIHTLYSYIKVYLTYFCDSRIFTLANEIDGKSIEIVYKYISLYKNAFVRFWATSI